MKKEEVLTAEIENDEISEQNEETLNDMEYDPNRFQQAVIWGTDWTAETINSQLVKGNIDLNPSFQRRDAWTNSEKSQLIESLMLGIPVPPIILAENKNKKNSYIVIDGKQRLLSIRRFFVNGGDSEFEPLKLSSLSVIKEINGCDINKIEEIAPDYITNLENQPIRTIVIKNWPDEPFLYNVFLRLNIGSKKLSAQELRQALKPGPFLDYLDDATAESKFFKKMLNNKTADPRMKDIELALRFFAYHYFFEDYRGNLKEFLDSACDKLNKKWSEMSDEIKAVFSELEKTIDFSYKIMNSTSPFSRYSNQITIGRFNKSIFELMSFYFYIPEIKELVSNNSEAFRTAFSEVNDDSDFVKALSGSTKEISNLVTRFELFYKILVGLSGSESITIPQIQLVDGKIKIRNGHSI